MAMLGLDASGAAISISPAHDSAVVRPEVLIWAVTLPGVAPDCGEITSQFVVHDGVLASAVKATGAPVLLVMDRLCAAGAVVPSCQSKLSWPGVTWIAGVPPNV